MAVWLKREISHIVHRYLNLNVIRLDVLNNDGFTMQKKNTKYYSEKNMVSIKTRVTSAPSATLHVGLKLGPVELLKLHGCQALQDTLQDKFHSRVHTL